MSKITEAFAFALSLVCVIFSIMDSNSMAMLGWISSTVYAGCSLFSGSTKQ